MTARTILFSNSSRVATPPCLAPHLCLRTQREVLLVDALGGMLRVGASGASLGSSPLRHVVGLQMYSDAEVLLALSVDGTLSTLRLSSSPEQSSESSDMEISVLKTSRISPNCTLLKYCPRCALFHTLSLTFECRSNCARYSAASSLCLSPHKTSFCGTL